MSSHPNTTSAGSPSTSHATASGRTKSSYASSNAPSAFRSGFVSLVGRPNAGKSTLLNACVGEKIAITSPVAQTTRKRLRAVVNTDDAQLVVVDTPGLHKPQDTLGRELNRSALSTFSDCDVVCALIDASAEVGRGDAWVAKHLQAADVPKILVITKADLVEPEVALLQLKRASALCEFNDAIVVSARENFNVDSFIELVSSYLPEGPRWFPEDMASDASLEDLVAEFVREKVLFNCRQEVPHAVAVVCDDIAWRKGGTAHIRATIMVERESQKGIVLGKGGRMIKRIGTSARADLERLLGAKVFLELSVEVRQAWRRDARMIRHLGYTLDE